MYRDQYQIFDSRQIMQARYDSICGEKGNDALVKGLHDNANKDPVIINFNKSSQSLHVDENWKA